MPDIAVTYDDAARARIKRAVEDYERRPRDRRIPQPTAERSSTEWLPFKNAYSGVIPAYAAMKITGGTDPATETGGTASPGTLMITCTQPDSTITSYAFNGPQDVVQNGYGVCQRSPVNCQVLYDTGTPAAGDVWGIKASQFSLTKGGIGRFVVDYPNDTTNKIMCGEWQGRGGTMLAKYTPSSGTLLSRGSSGTFTQWTGALGSEAVTSPAVTVTAEARFDAVDKSGFAWLENDGDGWYVVRSEHYARWLSGTISSLTSSVSATATMTIAVAHDGISPGSTVTVTDTDGLWGTISTSTKCKAYYNPDDGKYYLLWVSC